MRNHRSTLTYILSVFLGAGTILPVFAVEPIRLQAYKSKSVAFYATGDPAIPAGLPPAPPALPLAEVTAYASAGPVQWIGTPNGLIRIDKSAGPRDRVQYFASRRWLPADHVLALLADGDSVWVRTREGVSHIRFTPSTLDQKASAFEQRIAARHDRHGFVADSHFRTPGDPASNQNFSNDNDGLWTAMYAAAECFRYSVTKSPDALAKARKAVEAILFLEQVSGRPGFPARSYIKPGETQPTDGFWYDGKDGIRWKADTSSDEIVGHFLIFALVHDLLPDPDLKARVRATAVRIMDHILGNNLYLVDVTGKPTLWGKWHPDYFASETGRPDGPLNAAEILMFLKVTHHITGDAKYQREYLHLANDMGYAKLTTRYLELQEELNYSDEELALLSFYPLFLYEKDPALLGIYRQALDQWWKNIQRELNPLWTFIYAVANPAAKVDIEGAVWTMQRLPVDLVKWTIRNSHRADVVKLDQPDRHRRAEFANLLPADERPVMKWNGNPFVVDGGCGGCGEDDGTTLLLPYWLGHHHGLLMGK
ncbi:MAG TPA: hypothetical protein PLZ95_08265 [Bryobacteraceae bacterium]|nr:hypothetical protein [Bryobacteraceae bacterium]